MSDLSVLFGVRELVHHEITSCFILEDYYGRWF